MKDVEYYASKALENFNAGYNCCQAVVLAFKDELEIDEKTLARLSSGFGAGMGKQREVCGAVSGMFMVASVLKGYTEPKDLENKARTYSVIHSLGDEFKTKCGSIICRELLGISDDGSTVPEKRSAEYYKKRPCGELCAISARILAQELKKGI